MVGLTGEEEEHMNELKEEAPRPSCSCWRVGAWEGILQDREDL
jgi:hypothetical protein